MRFAKQLLEQYRAHALVAELEAWERMRAAVGARRYDAPSQANARTLIVLDGIPGAGKSTTQAWLTAATGAEYLSMARFAEARGVAADERRSHQLATGAPHAVDEEFLAALAGTASRYVVIEKFPRGVMEAVALLRAVVQHGWRLEVLHLQLPGDCVALSTQRQLARGPHHGHLPDVGDAQHRALVHLARTTSGRETLRASGVPIHAVDMTRPASESVVAIRRALGLDLDALRWHRAPLEHLAQVAAKLGIEAWAANGSVYRPFWNNRYGPAQLPTDLDVAVDDERAVEPLQRALRHTAPGQRWSVLAPATRLRARYGIETRTAAEAKAFATFLHRAGLVRWREGRIELVAAPRAEAALWSGAVELNPALLERSSEPQRAALVERDAHHLPRALLDYPGLSVAAQTASLLGVRGHRPASVGSRWRALKAAVREAQPRQSCAAVVFCRRALQAEERQLALQILQFHHHSAHEPEPPPLPPAREAPTPRAGIEELARGASDAEFGDWFLDQVHHHQPRGGADPFLKSVLELSLFAPALRAVHREQSAMHQGWPLERHLVQSVLQLRTDELLARLAPRHDQRWREDLRLCMRLAMLFHDTGKLLGRRPRHHAQISARLFARFRPSWFPKRLLGLTQWLIRTHDLFGAFGRGLTEKQGQSEAQYDFSLSLATSYFGALDSQAARQILLEPGLPLAEAAAINKVIWCADIGAIAALRWLIPVAELVERLLLVVPEARRTAADRRQGTLTGRRALGAL